MDFNRIRIALTTIGILACLAVAFIAGRKSAYVSTPERIVMWDTARIEVPTPQIVEKVKTEYVYLPADTVYNDREIVRVDSVYVAVDMEKRVYSDSLFRAVVSGPTIGDLHPSLDDIEVYSKKEVITIERQPKLIRPYVSACGWKDLVGIGGGVRINDKVDVGLKYVRVKSDNLLMVETNIAF